jgi:glycine/D-amino acid oxidase-like deaminating enzyme
MKRDGSKISLWQNGMPDYKSKEATNLDAKFDVLIVGGGITGITTALQLQRSGLQCVVAEAQNLCFGTTGGTTAHLNTFLDTSYNTIEKKFSKHAAALIAKAANQALELYQSNLEECNVDCGYEQKDGYLYSQDEKQTDELGDIFEASKRAGIDVA